MPALLLLLLLIATLLSLRQVWQDVPPVHWWQAMVNPDFSDHGQMLVHFVTLPRISASLLAGAALALSGVLFQQVLRNPLAEASTVGVSGGADLALKASILLAPSWALSPTPVACLGAAIAVLTTLGLAARTLASPLTLILAGLIVGLLCGVMGSVLALFFHEELRSVFLWNAGSLVNLGWDASGSMAPVLIACWLCALLLVRPLGLLDLDDGSVRSLGVPVAVVRLSGLLFAVILSAGTIATVGTIGFVGIAAPLIARMSGIRTFAGRVLVAPLSGAILLWLSDQIAQVNPLSGGELPAGVLTAVLGGPLLLWMLSRFRASHLGHDTVHTALAARARRSTSTTIAIALLLLGVFSWTALSFGRSLDGWHWYGLLVNNPAFEWRWPRVAAAALAGAMLAAAGTIIQKVTGNAMASPEILGISSGAACGVAILFLFDTGAGQVAKIAAASGGAILVMMLMFAMIRSRSGSPERMLLTGVALTTVLGALLAAITARFDPRITGLLVWLAGSTYSVTASQIGAIALIALTVAATLPLTMRWLAILPLGEETARAVGIDVGRSRKLLLLVASLLTGAAVLTIGPLSFVGLIAPHLARISGFRSPATQISISAVSGAIIMVAADWLGRNVLFPSQIPAGMLAALVGAPYFIWLMWRRTT
ncbi:Fe(3+)-hydroxamate ABC transporter permease FhuB [Agrobacterium sp. T29]|uniref:Fe(3+)-hydroxamate ABC transporter permease FhuB n=1 Tax=Agrobacterium sp. T29 TaxID=2580515 RepID=UPI00115F5B15|nr:Fe(3+)-hydroxamate ABC transporter permease FhuB [Agrobacterium sp. T29]